MQANFKRSALGCRPVLLAFEFVRLRPPTGLARIRHILGR